VTPAQRKAAALAIATALAIPAEGMRQVAYYDPPHVLTVCRGHTGKDVVKNKVYTIEECKAFMDQDMLTAVNAVERCVPGLPPEVLGPMADAVYNMGPKIACDLDKSTAARYLKAGNLVAACNELPKWSKAKVMGVLVTLRGLYTRRVAERDVCLKGLA
jgi:lysozyme